MRKIFTLFILAAACWLTSCGYDDNELRGKVDDLDHRITSLEQTVALMNSEISSIKAIAAAVESGFIVSDVSETSEGYQINFTDGNSVTIKSGKDGENGKTGDASIVGVAKHTDDIYYWNVTVSGTTEWLKDADGNMVPVTGGDGAKGEDGQTPVIGVDTEGYWTITLGGTTERLKDESGNEVLAVGKDGGDGDSFFESVTVTDTYVTIKLASGSNFTIPLANFSVGITADALEFFDYSEQRTFSITMENIDQYSVSKPTGWKVSVSNNSLSVTAPEQTNIYAEQTGDIVVTVVSNKYSGMAKLGVEIDLSDAPVTPSAPVAADGFYIVNEDWFGHDKGTVNYFGWDGSVTCREYRKANNGERLGTTTAFATIYGDNAYFVSKQGNRFVVADANTLTGKAVFTDIGGDGRAFTGVTPSKGYISTSRGITVFDIEGMRIGAAVNGISDETGSMVCVGNSVFAVTKFKGVYVIDTQTDTIKELIAGNFCTLTQSKDGDIWVADAANKNFLVINPHTLKTRSVDVDGYGILSTWSGWNPGTLCASAQQNAIYFINHSGSFGLGKTVIKYDIDHGTAKEIFVCGTTDGGTALRFYAGGMRVDPLTDKLIMMNIISAFNDTYIYVTDNEGNIESRYVWVDDGEYAAESAAGNTNYYWFPSMPYFKDMNAPEILIDNIVVRKGAAKSIDLNKIIHDADNIAPSIHKSISDVDATLADYSIEGDTLIIEAGETAGASRFDLTAISNGKQVRKTITVEIK